MKLQLRRLQLRAAGPPPWAWRLPPRGQKEADKGRF